MQVARRWGRDFLGFERESIDGVAKRGCNIRMVLETEHRLVRVQCWDCILVYAMDACGETTVCWG
jgi:hypothetical protein